MAGIEDPYFSGTVTDKLEPGDKPGPGQPPILAWLTVYLFNLIIPLFFGCNETDSSGKVGMVLGILLVFGLGCRLCFSARQTVLAVVYGGWVVAVSQFFPAAHIFAGLIGTRAASFLDGRRPDRPTDHVDSVLGGLVATLVTGAILLTMAAILGLFMRVMSFIFSRRVAAPSKH